MINFVRLVFDYLDIGFVDAVFLVVSNVFKMVQQVNCIGRA